MSSEEQIRNLNDAISLLAMLENSLHDAALQNVSTLPDLTAPSSAPPELSWRGMQLTVARCRSLIQSVSDELARNLYAMERSGPNAPAEALAGPSLIGRIRRMPLHNPQAS
jgi:hypothetical protein